VTGIGDSITCGFTLSDGNCPVGSTSTNPSPHAWPALVASTLGYGYSDYAVTRDEMADVWSHDIFAHGVQSHTTGNPLYGLLIGTNSADYSEDPGYFQLFHKAVLAWLATPRENMILPGDAGLVGSGGWSSAADTGSTNFTFGGAYDNSSAGTLTATLNTYGSPIYVWYTVNQTLQGDTSRCFTVAIDGGSQSSPFCTGPTTSIATQNQGSVASVALARFPVSAGTHSVVLSAGSAGGVAVQGVGTLPAIKTFGHPVIASGDIPNQNTSGGLTSPAVVAQYNAYVAADEALLAGDGAEIRHSPNQQYMHGTPVEMNDQVHPNASIGQPELAQAFLQTFQAVPSQSAQIANLQAQINALKNATTSSYSPALSSVTYVGDYDALKITGTANNAALSAWNDSSGNANNLTTSSGNPVFLTSGINSKPAVQFANPALIGGNNPSSNTFSVCAVLSVPGGMPSSGYYTVAEFASAVNNPNPNATAYFSPSGMGLFDGGTIASLSNSVPTSPFVGCWVFNGGNSYVAINGTSVGTASVGSSPTSTAITIGYAPNVGGLNASIGRLILFNGALSSADLTTITTAMRNEFGI
jgi:hypothetical protein